MNDRSLDYTISCSSPGWGYEFPAIGFYIMSATHRHTRTCEPYTPQPRTEKREGLAPPNTPTGRRTTQWLITQHNRKPRHSPTTAYDRTLATHWRRWASPPPSPFRQWRCRWRWPGTILSPRQKPAPAKPWALACPRFRASPGETTKAGRIWSSPAPRRRSFWYPPANWPSRWVRTLPSPQSCVTLAWQPCTAVCRTSRR